MIASEIAERLNLLLLLLRVCVLPSDSSGLLDGDNLFDVSFSGVCDGGLRIGDTGTLVSINGGVGRRDTMVGSDISARRKSSSA